MKLLFRGVQIDEEIRDLVQDHRRSRVFSIDLVNDNDHRQIRLEGLSKHKTRLWQRSLRGVHQQQCTVRHGQCAFHLTAEIRVSRCVYDVDLDALPANGAVLRCYRDAALALQIHPIHEAVCHDLALSKQPGTAKHCVYQCRFTVINVSDNRHVADVLISRVCTH